MPFSIFSRGIDPHQDRCARWVQLSVVRYGIINHVRMENPSRYQLPFWLIYRNLDPGAAIIDEEDRRTPIASDAIVVLPPWQDWRYHQAVDAVRHFAISVDLPQLTRSQVRKHFFGAQVIRGGRWRREIQDLATIALRMANDETQAPATSCMLQAVCCRVFEHLLARMSAVDAPPEPVRRILDLIEKDLAVALRRSTLERAAGCGIRALNRAFLASYGVSAAAFVRERRIAMAAELLMNSEWTIDRITQTVGFAQRAYFSRAFTQKMGISPALYRRQRRIR